MSSSLPEEFDFVRGCEEIASYGNIPTDTNPALVCPHDIAYIPQRHCFLVTEPFKHRIGIYEAETFKFVDWLPHPKSYKRYERPRSILSTASGRVFIVVRDKIEILDDKLNGYQFRTGFFCGLAEGESGEIFTMSYLRFKQAHFILRLSVGPNSFYKFTGQICLSVIGTFDNFKYSRPSSLIYSNKKLFITDEGIHKFYLVDLVTGGQKAFGHFGSGPGQLVRPTGIFPDDNGHLLVADGKKRLQVYSKSGHFIKVAVEDESLERLESIRRFKDFLIVMKSSTKESPRSGRVIWYRVGRGDSGLSTGSES